MTRIERIFDCPMYSDCLMEKAIADAKVFTCKDCKKDKEDIMAKSPQVTCSRETYERLERIRKESKMKWVDFLELCGVSRSQWDCIRNSKPMGQLVFERIADNLKIDYVWMMFGAVEDMAGYFQPIHDAGYPLPQENISDGGKELEGVKTVDSKGSIKSESQKNAKSGKAVKVLEMYEYKENGRLAIIGVKDGKYQHVYVEGINQHKWSYDDVMFLYKATGEVLRLVQG